MCACMCDGGTCDSVRVRAYAKRVYVIVCTGVRLYVLVCDCMYW